MKQDTQNVLFRILAEHGIRFDQRRLVAAITRAFALRARRNQNAWTYETTKALGPDVAPATFSRAVDIAVNMG